MYIVNFVNCNGLDSDNAVMIWDGENSVRLADELERAIFADFDTTPHIGEIIDCMIETRERLDRNRDRKGAIGYVVNTPMQIYIYRSAKNKIFDTYNY